MDSTTDNLIGSAVNTLVDLTVIICFLISNPEFVPVVLSTAVLELASRPQTRNTPKVREGMDISEVIKMGIPYKIREQQGLSKRRTSSRGFSITASSVRLTVPYAKGTRPERPRKPVPIGFRRIR